VGHHGGTHLFDDGALVAGDAFAQRRVDLVFIENVSGHDGDSWRAA
jgi:hypothetical protein